MRTHILDIILIGGVGVLFGYQHLELNKILPKLMEKYSKTEWRLWGISAILTIISFLSIIIWYSFFENSIDEDLFISSLIVFLYGAMFWSYAIAYQFLRNKKQKTLLELFALSITTLGSLGILISIIREDDKKWLPILAGSIVFFHHLFFDNYYWYFVQN